MKMRRAALFVLLLVAPELAAQTTFTRVLLPLRAGVTPGAFGSTWDVQTWVHYGGTEEAEIRPTLRCCFAVCPTGQTVPAGLPPFEVDRILNPTLPLLVHVEERFAHAFSFGSRVRELSRDSSVAGTDVPDVPEAQFTPRALQLVDVPVRAGFRTMLRIYALPEVPDPVVEVRYFRQPRRAGGTIDQEIVLLRADRTVMQWFPAAGTEGIIPSFVVLPDIQSLVAVAGKDAIWIEVVPLTPSLRIWAFAAVTNNVTHYVTLITP